MTLDSIKLNPFEGNEFFIINGSYYRCLITFYSNYARLICGRNYSV